MQPELQGFEPVFAEPIVEWAGNGQPGRFVFYAHASDSSQIKIHVTDFRSSTWEAVRSISQLDELRDSVGIGGSWSEFVDYLAASIKSQDVKLVLEGRPNSNDAERAKLVAQKSKGMPRVSFALTKLSGSDAIEANANLSLELFTAFKRLRSRFVQELEHSSQLADGKSAEEEKNKSIQSQLEGSLKRQKILSSEKADISAAPVTNGQNSPGKQARSLGPTKVNNRVVPAYRRSKVRGAFLQGNEDDEDN